MRSRKVHKPHLSVIQDARAIRTREQFRAAFLRLLEVKSIDRITIREISAAAKLNYVTFFRHYQTKEALLEEIAADEIRRLVELSLPVFDAGKASASTLALCTYVNEHRKLWTALLAGGAAATLRQEFIDVSREAAVTRQSVSWPPQEIAVTITVSSMVELLTWWLKQDAPLPVHEVADICEGFIITPALKAAAARQRRASHSVRSRSSRSRRKKSGK